MEDIANAYYADDEDSLSSSTDSVFLGPFNMVPIASLASQQIHLSIGIPLVGGFSFSVWGIFVLVELTRQVLRFASGAFDRAAPPALPGGAMVQMAVSMATLQMGGSGQQYVKVLGQLYGIYQSLVEDLSVFVVLLGVAVGFADLYVSYYGSSSSSNGV
ncbi:hypothetical protein BC830DRAFT_1149802 [Chytriomyces sp. MP71]|nr:hypothetical protein BC830DRAFT_1149802 [Chytriomyces sp. MP71]